MSTYSTTITVRGYELDSYGHVNNAVYLQYLEHARWEMIREMGIVDYLRSRDHFLVVTETHIRYMREANLFDELEIQSSVKHEAPYLVFTQKIRNKATKVPMTRAKVKTLFINRERVAQDIPDQFKNI
jgi:YbgC/YbaW family acyl-CoA thioester hydrolase